MDTPETSPIPVRGPQISNIAQYVKDVSFESPNSPASVLEAKETPTGELMVQIKAHKLGGDQYEIIMEFQIEGSRDGETAFLVELHYAGVFVVSGFSEEAHQKALMIECPRLLFPFARRVIADMVRDGGFPQLLLGTINFVQVYKNYLQKAEAEAEAEAAVPPADA